MPAADQSIIACSPSAARSRDDDVGDGLGHLSDHCFGASVTMPTSLTPAAFNSVEHVHLVLHVEPAVDAQEDLLVRACEHQLPDALGEHRAESIPFPETLAGPF